MKLLIADDSIEIRMLLYATAEYSGFEPLMAGDGEEAIQMFDENEDIALILTDVYMPLLDGIAFARHVRKKQRSVHIPIVFMTEVNADERLAEFLEICDDLIIKPFSQTVILAKLAAHRRLVEIHRRLAQQNHELVQFRKTTEAEHFVASDVISRSMKGGMTQLPGIRFITTPMTDFNGDSVVIARNRSGSAYVMVADVSGHGLPAAMGTIPLIEGFLAGAWDASGVGGLAAQLNRIFRDKMPDYLLSALLLAEISPDGERLLIWNGGMPPAMVLDADGHVVETLHSAHMPLGARRPAEFDEGTTTVRLTQGRRLLCFSDGVSEARDDQGRMFGLDGIRTALGGTGPCTEPVQCLAAALREFRHGRPATDDVTMLTYSPCGPLPPVARREDRQTPAPFLPFHVQFSLGPDQLRDPQALPALLGVFKAHPTLTPSFSKIAVVMSELFSNSLDHGVMGLSSDLKNDPDGMLAYHEARLQKFMALPEDALITVEGATFLREGTPMLKVVITDSGPGFDYQSRKHPDPGADDLMHGRGVGIINHLTASVSYLGAGNIVQVEMALKTR